MSVSENINNYLADKGISKTHVANRSGIPRSRFTLLTTGKTRMFLSEYLAICKALDVKVTKFIDE